ncbi:hypothetical protein SYK_23580 [Pseudodesulfovibrio nedwellii]|uniref:Response regulator n=1 Tax=Pseudodesulfovibrio nedwellii TaxID=2973072 RepID=A0ABM8B2Y6_9BACT|nr:MULTISPECIES: hypothetical protein [Pseudodesulfovibrio]BDQ37998.1 hypothetical protein SYK_23580 [Pseudodesulfovibrio nedwellii]
MSIVFATTRGDSLGEFIDSLADSSGQNIDVVPSGAAALEAVKDGAVKLVVIDEGLSDFDSLTLALEVIKVNAMVNTATVTSLSDEDFHDKSEGLGVLKGLPLDPGKKDGVELAEILGRM